jgi:hypothetical protein
MREWREGSREGSEGSEWREVLSLGKSFKSKREFTYGDERVYSTWIKSKRRNKTAKNNASFLYICKVLINAVSIYVV